MNRVLVVNKAEEHALISLIDKYRKEGSPDIHLESVREKLMPPVMMDMAGPDQLGGSLVIACYFDANHYANTGISPLEMLLKPDHWVATRKVGGDGVIHAAVDCETNNEAEWASLEILLNHLVVISMNATESIRFKIHGDSRLVLEQVQGNFKVKARNLFQYYQNCTSRLDHLRHFGHEVEFEWVPREINNQALGLPG